MRNRHSPCSPRFASMRASLLKLCSTAVPARCNYNNCHRHLHWPVPLPPMLDTFDQASNLPETTKKKKHNISTTTKTNHANGKKPLPEMQQAIMTKKKHTLVLDIDETLLYYNRSVRHENKRLENYQVYLRPHVGAFLKEMHELFEVVIFTAAASWYGAAMTNVLEKAAGCHEPVLRRDGAVGLPRFYR
ncbi:Hypothetical protein, putative [Bodo saltans]|uniref:Mitochondrial import inner membrane translocase subunit TIM50 n=1 Tax=Bodo saltans TaxID=75058 RepID=A0A0S4J6D3_BODSA|nr:Hypothetical protein, putative [Bodo saltans]|eukprot:CUG85239.1 Hypothetical protein, putative [Bodo saltans]